MTGRPASAIDWAGPWCLQCARAATDLGPALQPGYRVITCRWDDPQGNPRGCGKTLGTLDRAEAETLVERKRIARLTREHPDHRTATRTHMDCPTCQLRGPHLAHVHNRRPGRDCRECQAAGDRVKPARVGRY
jgi:hypothetical protein